MRWWMDLIWVGNTLYPRWFVFGIIGVFVLTVSVLFTWLSMLGEK